MLVLPACATGSIHPDEQLPPGLLPALEVESHWLKAAGKTLVCMDGRPHDVKGADTHPCGIALPGGTITVAVAAAHALTQWGGCRLISLSFVSFLPSSLTLWVSLPVLTALA